ncbi:MAG: type II toxin-antitoxin system VapC family toxin [Amaricoccus sp.]
MIALDTNVLVRFLVADDPAQARRARDLLAGLDAATPAFVCREVVLELAWVLERTDALDRSRIADAFDGLLAAREILIESADDLATAVAAWRAGGPGLVTFDRKAARLPGARLLDEAAS